MKLVLKTHFVIALVSAISNKTSYFTGKILTKEFLEKRPHYVTDCFSLAVSMAETFDSKEEAEKALVDYLRFAFQYQVEVLSMAFRIDEIKTPIIEK